MSRKNTLWLAVAAGVGVGLTARKLLRGHEGFDLFGKVALIVGGARGVGLAAAHALGAEGCRIAICGRDAAELEQARQNLAGHGIGAFVVRCDVTDCAQAEGMVGAVIERHGSIDILVNYAGETQVERPDEVLLEDFERAMDEMFWSTVYPIRAVLPHMLERRRGRIVNVAPARQATAASHRVAYECAERAAMGLSEGLGRELAPDGITVAAVTPGPGMSMERAARHVVSAARRGESAGVITRAATGMVGRILDPAVPNGNGHQNGEPAWMWMLGVLGRTAARRYLDH